MQGGRKPGKWVEIQNQLEREEINVYALAETHLRDLEAPPVIDNYVWEGCNRTSGMKKGGGVGMLIKQGTDWQRVHESCKEHLWVKGTIAGKNTWLGVAYLWTGSGVREANEEMINCLKRDINEFKGSGEVILVGDMNAHIEELDGYTDHNGSLVIDLCQENRLVIVNTENKCNGQITWESGNRQSSIDYSLVSETVYERLREMNIDENGTDSLGSDHKRLTLHFGSATRTNLEIGTTGGSNLSNQQLKKIADMMEDEVMKYPDMNWDYDEITGYIKQKMDEAKQQNRWKGKKKPRSWWNKEISEAIEQRKKASREHREAKRTGMQPDLLKEKWDNYREKKLGVQKLVQAKIKEKSDQWMAEIRKKDKSAPKKFWNHVKALGSKKIFIKNS